MGFSFSAKSKAALEGVHPDLVKIAERAIQISPIDFKVLEGLRTVERQKKLVAIGASRTMRSRHITGHAVDLGALIDFDGDGDTELRWDWPLYEALAKAMKQAADEVKIPLEWGGDWKTFKDGPHFQLPRFKYPAND